MNIWQQYYKQHNLWKEPHEYGMCQVNDQHKLFYVLIPKNASTFFRDNTSNLGFRDGNYHSENLVSQGYTPIITLRDPVERWCSGMTEYISRRLGGKWSPLLKNEQANRFLFSRVAFDEHTESQHMYIHGLEKSMVLRFDDELSRNLAGLLRANGIENELDKLPTRYASSGNKLDCKNFLMDMLRDDITKMNRIKSYYRLDIGMYNHVKYYIRGVE